MSDIPSAAAPERPGDGWSAGSGGALPSPAIAVDVPLAGQRLQRFLDELASDAPTPGGGAWAGVAAAAGAAMIAMVARLTLKKKGYEEVAGRMAAMAEECDEERHILMGLADRDAAAYRDVMAAYKLPKDTSEQEHTRSFTLQRALEAAADVPLEVARRSVYLMGLAEEAIQTGNPNAASDAYSAAAALHAAALSALANVDINAITFVDKTRQRELSDSSSSLRNRAQSILRDVGEAFVIAVHS
jgi:formiminotetrahydrofolate cyclodeaminase